VFAAVQAVGRLPVRGEARGYLALHREAVVALLVYRDAA
jgi:hypothetical protein